MIRRTYSREFFMDMGSRMKTNIEKRSETIKYEMKILRPEQQHLMEPSGILSPPSPMPSSPAQAPQQPVVKSDIKPDEKELVCVFFLVPWKNVWKRFGLVRIGFFSFAHNVSQFFLDLICAKFYSS